MEQSYLFLTLPVWDFSTSISFCPTFFSAPWPPAEGEVDDSLSECLLLNLDSDPSIDLERDPVREPESLDFCLLSCRWTFSVPRVFSSCSLTPSRSVRLTLATKALWLLSWTTFTIILPLLQMLQKELSKGTLLGDQLMVSSNFRNFTLLQHDDVIYVR